MHLLISVFWFGVKRDGAVPHYFKELPDPRQAGKVIYPLAEVLLLCLLAVLAGAESFVDIARFGEKKINDLAYPVVTHSR